MPAGILKIRLDLSRMIKGGFFQANEARGQRCRQIPASDPVREDTPSASIEKNIFPLSEFSLAGFGLVCSGRQGTIIQVVQKSVRCQCKRGSLEPDRPWCFRTSPRAGGTVPT